MVSSVFVDWLEGKWLRGFRVDEETPHHFSHPTLLPKMNPRVTGNHPRNSYSLDTRPGTITQVETHAFATSFLGTGSYPTFRRVSPEIMT